MTWHITDAQSLALIDREVQSPALSPAQYEIVRRVIYATADFEFLELVEFSDRVLTIAAAALASRTTILVDVPMVQVGIVPHLQKTFANPVYCGTQTITRPQKEYTEEAWGMLSLATRYPDGIFVIGHSQTALNVLVKLVEKQHIQPALIVATPTDFLTDQSIKARLKQSKIPSITIRGRKGNAVVAVAIINALVDLAWQAYEQKAYPS
ncbi:MAG: precorrin-8X methylmutase [Synechocystis sp.]|nr:precorrin-8X methylmutase [Synechocystis sp.]